MTDYVKTSGEVAREAGLSNTTLTKYVQLGLLPCRRTKSGWQLFPENAPALARAIHKKRMANAGRPKRKEPQPLIIR